MTEEEWEADAAAKAKADMKTFREARMIGMQAIKQQPHPTMLTLEAARDEVNRLRFTLEATRKMLDSTGQALADATKALAERDAEIGRWRNFQGPADQAALDMTSTLTAAGHLPENQYEGPEGTPEDYAEVWRCLTKGVSSMTAALTERDAEIERLRGALKLSAKCAETIRLTLRERARPLDREAYHEAQCILAASRAALASTAQGEETGR